MKSAVKAAAKTKAIAKPLGAAGKRVKAAPVPAERAAAKSDGPLYRQVVQVLRDEILDGTHPVGAQLPTESEMTERFGVSRHTIREALRQLRDDGLVASRQGAGTTVVRPSSNEGYVHEVASINDLITYAASIRYRVDSNALVEADEEMVSHLGGEVGQQWLRITGFRYGDDQAAPVCWTLVYLRSDYSSIARLIGRRPGAIWELIEDHFGERVHTVEQVLRARTVPDDIAATLQVDKGATVISVQRTYRNSKEKVMQASFNLYPAERFSFAMTMRRQRA